MTRRTSVSFDSEGIRCRGDMYVPSGIDNPPVVILAHGFGGQRTWGLPRHVSRFVEHGYAALLFDYRTFGESDGQPRTLISPRRQLRDWNAAIDYIHTRDDIDSDRLALWGTSFSGGHVVATAARRDDVNAIISLVPATDGLVLATNQVRRRGISSLRRVMTDAAIDISRALRGGEPHTIPIAGRPDEYAVLNTPEVMTGLEAIIPEDESFRNECPARIIPSVIAYRPITVAESVDCPAFVVEATRDTLVPPWTVERLVMKLQDVERIKRPIGHYDVLFGDTFDRVVERELAFLDSSLHP